jgi:hypothetical protein
MKLIGILLIIGILFSYVPVMPMDDCPEGDHHTGDHQTGARRTGNMTMNCGNCFHCPILSNMSTPDPMPLPLSGRLVVLPFLLKIDEVPFLIFHPPKALAADFS